MTETIEEKLAEELAVTKEEVLNLFDQEKLSYINELIAQLSTESNRIMTIVQGAKTTTKANFYVKKLLEVSRKIQHLQEYKSNIGKH